MAQQIGLNIDSHRFWLLHYLHRDRWPISELTSSNLELHLNRRGHNRTVDQLVDLLSDMVGQGLVYATRHDLMAAEGPRFKPDRHEIRRELDWGLTTPDQTSNFGVKQILAPDQVSLEDKSLHLPLLFLGLTELGGQVWEHTVQPEWDRYFESSGSESLCSTNRAVLERYLEMRVGAGDFADHVEWDVVEPWEITYWKTFALAHRVRFTFRKLPSDAETRADHQAGRLRFELWLRQHQFNAVTHRMLV